MLLCQIKACIRERGVMDREGAVVWGINLDRWPHFSFALHLRSEKTNFGFTSNEGYRDGRTLLAISARAGIAGGKVGQ